MAFITLGTISGTKVTTYKLNSQDEPFSSTELSSAGSRTWMSIDASEDGSILLAGVHGGYFYLSTDSGNTWTEITYIYSSWKLIMVSPYGNTLLAGGNSSGISGGTYSDTNIKATNLYVSNDYGVTWNTPIIPPATTIGVRHYYAACCSLDGTILYACLKSYHIIKSINSGETWTSTNSVVRDWNGISCSDDGTKVAAVVYNGGIYISTNSGSTWTLRFSTVRFWSGIASTFDGTKLFAVVNGSSSNYYYFSTNSGTSWSSMESTFNDIRRTSVNTSYNGSVVAVGGMNSYITISYNNGVTWTTITSMPISGWVSPILSRDGKRIFIADSKSGGGFLYFIRGF